MLLWIRATHIAAMLGINVITLSATHPMQVLTIQSKEQNALVSDRICFLTPTLSTEIKKVEGWRCNANDRSKKTVVDAIIKQNHKKLRFYKACLGLLLMV
jgi:hypothetical protein